MERPLWAGLGRLLQGMVTSVTDFDVLDRALDRLCADESPRHEAFALGPSDVRMLRFAQLMRGTPAPPPRPQFVERLLALLFSDHEARMRIRWHSTAERSSE